MGRVGGGHVKVRNLTFLRFEGQDDGNTMEVYPFGDA
jgi:hypothetical protein